MGGAQKHSKDTELVVLLTTIVIHLKTCAYIGENYKLQMCCTVSASPGKTFNAKKHHARHSLTMLYQTEKIFWPLTNR